MSVNSAKEVLLCEPKTEVLLNAMLLLGTDQQSLHFGGISIV